MIDSSAVGRRALGASALGAVLCLGLCSFGGTGSAGGGASALPALAWSVSPDGEWLAVSAARGRQEQYDAWVIAVDDGGVRELNEVERAAPQIAFDARNRMRIFTLDSERGTPLLTWADPRSGAVLEGTRDRSRIRAELETPLEHGWARVEQRRVGQSTTARRVEWPAERLKFELDAKRDVELAVSSLPGVVLYSRRVGDQLRLVRRELNSSAEQTLVADGRGLTDWTWSEDGRAVAVHEQGIDSRVRVVDAQSGALIAGPWLGDSVEWAPGGGSRFLMIEQAGQRRLVDTLLGATHDAGAWQSFRMLSDGHVIAQVEHQLVLLDAELSEVRVLFDAALPTAQTER
jgi:dipeptidyl aminopeptidase/acylaminoacyl peptidase